MKSGYRCAALLIMMSCNNNEHSQQDQTVLAQYWASKRHQEANSAPGAPHRGVGMYPGCTGTMPIGGGAGAIIIGAPCCANCACSRFRYSRYAARRCASARAASRRRLALKSLQRGTGQLALVHWLECKRIRPHMRLSGVSHDEQRGARGNKKRWKNKGKPTKGGGGKPNKKHHTHLQTLHTCPMDRLLQAAACWKICLIRAHDPLLHPGQEDACSSTNSVRCSCCLRSAFCVSDRRVRISSTFWNDGCSGHSGGCLFVWLMVATWWTKSAVIQRKQG